MQLVLPVTSPYVLSYSMPLFFLAGPIKGGDDWHLKMTRLLMSQVNGCIIVNPSRYAVNHPLYQYRVAGKENVYARQTDWEHYFLHQAGIEWLRGCIIFWLPVESKTRPCTGPKPYAMDTRGEIGVWRGHRAYNSNVRLVVGADEGFPGLSTIQRNFELDIGPDFKIHSTMEDVAEQAMVFANR